MVKAERQGVKAKTFHDVPGAASVFARSLDAVAEGVDKVFGMDAQNTRDSSPAVSELSPLAVFDEIFSRCHGDSLIAIGSRRPLRSNPNAEVPHALIAVPVRARREWLPEIFQYQLEHSQYFMPNTFNKGALVGKRETPIGEHARIRWFAAKNRYVRELAALVVDLDCYKHKVDAAEAVGEAIKLILRGLLPMPGMVAHSGRGAYLLWLLRDEDTLAPPPATQDNATAWQENATEIVRRTDHLGGDANAKHLANWYKRPGTKDTKTGNIVTYLAMGNSLVGFLPRYKLTDLQASLGVYHHQIDTREAAGDLAAVRPFKALPAMRRRKPAEERQRHVALGKGGEAAGKRVAEMERLNNYRQGFRKSSPSRKVAVWLYYLSLRAYLRANSPNMPDALVAADREAFRRTVSFASTFQPALTAAEVRTQTGPRRKPTAPRYFTARRMAEALGVSAEEARTLDLDAIAPPEVRKANRARLAADQQARRDVRADRQHEIAAMIRQGSPDAKVAEALGLHRSTVGRIRKRLFQKGVNAALFIS